MFFNKIKYYLTEDIWDIWLSSLPKKKAFFININRILILTGVKIRENDVIEKAATLTFFTLLSIVPVVALSLAVTRSFNLENAEERFRYALSGQEQVADWIIKFAEKTLQTASNGIVTGIGGLLLIWTVIKLLSNVEKSFNLIWGIPHNRTWMRKISDYITLLLFYPILIFVIVSFCALGVTKLEILLNFLPNHKVLIDVIRYVIPCSLAWGSFTFLYIFMPNTKVNFISGLAGGIFGGTCFILLQYIFIYLQKSVSTYNAIYGGFAAFPIFLIWLRLCWTLTLIGAQLSFSVQNVNDYEFYPRNKKISLQYLEISTLRIMKFLINRIKNHESKISAEKLSQKLEIPIQITMDLLQELVKAEILVECHSNAGRSEYLPCVPLDELNPISVLKRLTENGRSAFEGKDYNEWIQCVNELWKKMESSPSNHF